MASSPDRIAVDCTNDQLHLKDRHSNDSRAPIIRRARVACLLCRGRKIRCDAAHNGVPCTNCKLNGGNCVVKSKPGKTNTSKQVVNRPACDVHATRARPRKKSNPKQSPVSASTPNRPKSKREANERSTTPLERGSTTLLSCSTASCDTAQRNYTSFDQNANRTPGEADIIYSYYPFLSADTIHQLEPGDLQYLEKLGCYRVPLRESLDEAVKAYFRYIHAHQPILDEPDFWRAYTSTPSIPTRTISIFVFQAMLFAACSFVSLSTINRLGFSSFHVARATFYRRAKALFHIDSNRDALSSAQGALLLTYYVSALDAKVNTYWLSNAIYLAKSVNAHRYTSLHKVSAQQWSQLQRLWCCCILRDRILALGLRRPMQIGAEDGALPAFDHGIHQPHTGGSVMDFSPLDRGLTGPFPALYSLAALLGQVLRILSLDTARSSPRELTTTVDKVQACSKHLDEWFAESKARFHSAGSADKLVILQSNVIYIYYQSAKVALWNHAIHVSIAHHCPVHMGFSEGWQELEAAIHGIGVSLQEIADHDMLSFMPIGIVANIAMPVVWHVLKIKLHRQGQQVDTRKGLSIYITALNQLKKQYEGVDRVLQHIRQVVVYLDEYDIPYSLQSPASQSLDNSSSDIGDGARLPRFYLRAMITVQLALAKGQYPEEHELPPAPTSFAGDNAQNACTCIPNESWDLPDLGDAFDAMMDTALPDNASELRQAASAYLDYDGVQTLQSPPSSTDFDELLDVFMDA